MTGFRIRVVLVLTSVSWIGLSTTTAAAANCEVDIRSKDGKIVVPADKIRSYDWKSHVITLAPDVVESLFDRLKGRLVAGVPFSVAVGGKSVYRGTFTTGLSSYSFSTPVIILGGLPDDSHVCENNLRIQLGYPTKKFFKGKDPRSDPRIRSALAATTNSSPARRLTASQCRLAWFALSLQIRRNYWIRRLAIRTRQLKRLDLLRPLLAQCGAT